MTRDDYIDAVASWLAVRNGWSPNDQCRRGWAHVTNAYREDAVNLLETLGLEGGHPDEMVWTARNEMAGEPDFDTFDSEEPDRSEGIE